MQRHKNYGACTYLLFALLTFALKMAIFNCDLTLNENTQAKLTANLLNAVRSNYDRVISPVSTQDSLIVAALGGESDSMTEKELQLAAEVSGSKDDLAKNLEKLSSAVNLKNKLYVNRRLQLNSKYVQRIKDIPADFVNFSEKEKIAATINDFVARHTENRLEKNKLIVKRVDVDTTMIALDLIEFSAKWSIPVIAKKSTRRSMYMNGNFLYGRVEALNATAAVLPFKRSKARMLLVFANGSNNLMPLENALRKVDVIKIPSVLNYTQTDLYVPRFKFETVYSLHTQTLEKLKIKEALSGNAKFNDFFKQNVKSYLKNFDQFSSIRVDKNGVQFASATSVQYELTSSIPPYTNRTGANLVSRSKVTRNPYFFFIINGNNILAAGSSYNKW